jgi:hypothetical protein
VALLADVVVTDHDMCPNTGQTMMPENAPCMCAAASQALQGHSSAVLINSGCYCWPHAMWRPL